MPNIGVAERQTYDAQVRPKFRRVSNENATLGVHDRVVVVDVDTANAIITLPNVAEAAGKTFTITTGDVAGTGELTVTVTDRGESMNWEDIESTATVSGKLAVLYSDGLSWFQLI